MQALITEIHSSMEEVFYLRDYEKKEIISDILGNLVEDDMPADYDYDEDEDVTWFSTTYGFKDQDIDDKYVIYSLEFSKMPLTDALKYQYSLSVSLWKFSEDYSSTEYMYDSANHEEVREV